MDWTSNQRYFMIFLILAFFCIARSQFTHFGNDWFDRNYQGFNQYNGRPYNRPTTRRNHNSGNVQNSNRVEKPSSCSPTRAIDSVEPIAVSDDKDCSMMQDPFGIVPGVMKDYMCRSYYRWNRDIAEEPVWHPTARQAAWWHSMGFQGTLQSNRGGQRHQSRRSARREYRLLSDQDRNRFHNAVVKLKNSYIDGMSKYDLFVVNHQATSAPGAHFGPAFLGWHREMIFRFENALQEIDPSVTLPYWDSNLDSVLGDDVAVKSIMWSPLFAGNGVGDVTTGPFAGFPLLNPSPGHRVLWRNLTNPGADAEAPPMLMPDEAVRIILEAPRLRDVTWFVDMSFEAFHGGIHNWVSGPLGDLDDSPSDPVFFLLHAYVDCLFERMRQNQQRRGVQVQFDYPNDTVALGVSAPGDPALQPEDAVQYSLADMIPFAGLRNIDGLSLTYTAEHYTCAPSPTCSAANLDCGSSYLFCVRPDYRCAPKLQIGAKCACFADSQPCYEGHCCNGVCQHQCRY